MKNKKCFFYYSVGMLFTVCVAGGGCQAHTESNEPPVARKSGYLVNAVKADIPKGALKLEYSGVVIPRQSVELSFKLAGTVSRVLVEEGESVKKGQKLAVIDKSLFQSTFRAALAMQKQAEDAFVRLQQVHEKGSLPDVKYQEILSKLEQANASLQIAKDNLKHCILTAPTDGVIAMKHIEPGNNVTPNLAVMELVLIDEVYVRVSVPENEISYLKKGQQGNVAISAIGSKSFVVKVDQVGVSANPISRTYEVKLVLSNSDHLVKPGMATTVQLDIPQSLDSPTIPLRAILQDENKTKYIYLIDQKRGDEKMGKAIRTEVQLGSFYKNSIYVTAGLKGGELVVVDGQHKLSPDSEIAYQLLK